MVILRKMLKKLFGNKIIIYKLASVGKKVEIDRSVYFAYPERIKIGNYVHIEGRVFCEGKGGIDIDDYVIIAPEVVMLSSMHRFKGAQMLPYDEVDLLKPITIERCVWIGMRAMILPGVTLGEGCIVGAAAVVTKSFPPGSILAGNPAVAVGQRDMIQYRRLISESKFYLKLKQELNLKKKEYKESLG